MITIHTNISMQIWQIKDLQQFFINRRKPIKALRQRRKGDLAVYGKCSLDQLHVGYHTEREKMQCGAIGLDTNHYASSYSVFK